MELARVPVLLACSAIAAFPQPSRPAAEVFGTLGVFRVGGDEGSMGRATTYGGTATIPFAMRWGLDVPVLAARPANYLESYTSMVIVSPGVQYRRGTERALWFIAFGPGFQTERTRGTIRSVDASGKEMIFPVDDTQSGLTIHWRTGAVMNPTGRLLVRGDFFWAHRYVLPNIGIAVSLGYRLGR